MTDLKAGDAVEINQVWAGGRGGPHRAWQSNYTFVRYEGQIAVVKVMSGFAAGCDVKYPLADVRPA